MNRISFLRELWEKGGDRQRFCRLLLERCGSWEKAGKLWESTVTDFLGADEFSALPRSERFRRAEVVAIEYLTQELSDEQWLET